MTPLDYGLYAASVLIWGFSWIAMHYQVGKVAPEVSVIWRFAIAAPLMFMLAMARGERLRFPLADHRYFVALGAAIFSTNFILFYYAAQHVASGLLSIVFSLASVGNVILGALVFGTRVERRIVVGGVLGVAGVAAMFYPELGGLSFNGTAMLGLLLALGGTLSFCSANMVSVAAQRRRLPVFASAAWGMTYGVSFVTVLALARGETFTIDWSVTYLGGLAYLSILGSFVAFGVYFTLLGRIGAARTGYTTVMYPVVALMVSTFAEDYRWSLLGACGLAAVLLGNVLILRTPKG
ncbi:DMT family transporter [Undibacter mobilis]|uniref:DMT family transporter n=1 Tax=Undibacter mobilis TaxID=2292256 RepID=A0A371BDP2_9BRAD|nr:DMT family transporter [Undibacter mobilis]